MDGLKRALDTFRSAHSAYWNKQYAVGYGMDPTRKGPNGIIVFAHSNDAREQFDLMRAARDVLPHEWDGFPVYFDGKPVPPSY